MRGVSIDRSSFAQTAIVSLATLAALATLGLVLAYWSEAWFAGRPIPVIQGPVEAGGNIAVASDLFGTVQREQHIAAPAGIAIKLLGVVAASAGRRGYAVMQLDSKEILAVLEGENIASGVRLAEVHPNHIILERNGLRETLAWPGKDSSTDSPLPSGINSPPESVTPQINE
ncbi:type II secretion system protein N [Nitrosospira sp. NpAV]|uniref:type II secretion system protein N n=1 Tax=Nitrosospira sp. NpAV TaxID=58133 RepID=UPI0005A15F31|nr:type II secretion system protein N [Nitrosospira sp. NpAV]KIO49048.1 general secretion pathway protein [Nitrosospira sp. NpAV]